MESEEQTTLKQCYYEVMGVDINATDDQIKKAYKKLSLKYHPDKNRKDPEGAKQIFQGITEAYNCLSEPKERLWYNNNREKLLMNKSDMTREDLERASYGFDIFAYFDRDAFEDFNDEEDGFFTVYRQAFEKVDYEEERTHKFQLKDQDYTPMPSFGDSKTPIEEVVKFYEAWQNFFTCKNFAWADEHDVREGENRYEKRQMEQDNEKLRKKEKKQYIATIKDLMNLCKKKDPRRAQLIELQKKEQEKIEQQRNANKSEKQRKLEEQQKKQEEIRKKKEEERLKKFQEQQEKIKAEQERLEQEKLLQEQQKKNKAEKKPKKPQQEIDVSTLFDANGKPLPNLTKKQMKEVKKIEAQKLAEKNKQTEQESIQKKKEEKKQQELAEAQQQQQQQQQAEEESKENNNDGEKKKKKKKNKKKAEPQEEVKQQVVQKLDDDYFDKQQAQIAEQEDNDDEWQDAKGSMKEKKQILKEMKKNRAKAAQSNQ